jgi:branched-chain amino acid aminotransferase
VSDRVAYINGKFVPEAEASVSIYDQGFLSGIGVFERTRTFKGVPFRLDEHLERLYLSLRMTGLSAGASPEEMKRVTLDLLAMNAHLLGPHDDYSIGHFVSIGPSGQPTVIIFTQPVPFTRFAHQYQTGAHVVTPSIRQVPVQVLDPKLKTTSRMHFHLAEREARLVDPDAYALILDLDGNVCEVSPGANFWIVRRGRLISPPGESILRGISRDVVFEIAAQMGIPAEEREFQVYDIISADEAFLSVTSRSILPVTRINGAEIGDGAPGPTVARLQMAWSHLVGVDIVAQALAHISPEPVQV